MQAQYLPHKGELSALVKQNHYHRESRGSGSQNCGCDQEGRRLNWETRVEKMVFDMFPKRCDRGTVSYLKGGRVPKNWGIVTEGIREVFD